MNRCMEIGRMGQPSKRIWTGIVMLIIAMSAVFYFYLFFHVFHLNIKAIFVFLVTILAAIQIPGIFCLHLLNFKFKSRLTKYPIGFFCGFAVLTFVYYISVWLDSVLVLYLYTIGVSFIACCYAIRIVNRQRKTKHKKYRIQNIKGCFDRVEPLFLIYIALTFFGCVIFLQ